MVAEGSRFPCSAAVAQISYKELTAGRVSRSAFCLDNQHCSTTVINNPRGLSHLDKMTVWILEVATNFGSVVLRLG